MRTCGQRSARLLAGVLVLASPGCPPATPAPPPPPPQQDGFDDAPASGLGFVVDDMGVTPHAQAMDLDGNGTPDGAINRALDPMLGTINNAFRSAVLAGRICVALEVVGLDAPYACGDDAVTLKYYRCDDADQDPANNFCGAPECGRMVLSDEDIVDGQALYRSLPTPIVDCRVHGELEQVLQIDLEGDVLPLEQSQVAAFVPDTLHELLEVQIAGVTRARDTQLVSIPICEYMPVLCINPNTPDEISLAQYMRLIGEHPDVDLDDDGLERYDLDGQAQVVRCIDGDGTVLESPTCLDDARIADGFSMCLSTHAVTAVLLLPEG
jgi:hypothetical protein